MEVTDRSFAQDTRGCRGRCRRDESSFALDRQRWQVTPELVRAQRSGKCDKLEEMRRQGLYRAQGGIGLPTRFVSDLFPVYGTLFVPFIAKKRSLTTPIGKKGKKDGHFGQKDCQEC